MTTRSKTIFGLVAAATLATGCADLGTSHSNPQLGTENGCYVATDSARCRLNHDLSGGYPITRGGRG